jgi:glycosyltransferase involved in cell wall biosynthesis
LNLLNVVTLINPELGGGVAERVLNMSRSLSDIGIRTTILALDINIDENTLTRKGNSSIKKIKALNKRFYIPSPFALFSIVRAVKNSDIIHMSNHWSLLNALIYIINKIYKKPYIYCPAGSLNIDGRSKLFKKIYNFLIGKKILKNAANCIAITKQEKRDFEQYKIDKNKIILIPNGVNLSIVDKCLTSNVMFKIPKKYILYVGRLNYIKGIDLLIDAYCSITSQEKVYFDLVIAGTDEGLKNKLIKKLQIYNLTEKVHFMGFLSGMEKELIFANASLLVIPSRSEAMSIVVLEAAIHALPVLCTNKCGLENFYKLGLLEVVDSSLAGITYGIREFIKSDGRKKQGSKLNEYVCNNYLWEHISIKYYDLICKIINY